MENLNEADFTIKNIEKVVEEFYTTSRLKNEFNPQLDNWLKLAQNSKEAWTFAWHLIDMNKPPETQFFGASCLYNKVSKYFFEVPCDQYDILKNKLLEKLLIYAIKNEQQQVRLIQRKLNSTLAKLALFLIEDQWQNCIIDIIRTIPNCLDNNEADNNKNNIKTQLICIVIDLLTLLPEEFGTLTSLSKAKRTQINIQLKKNFHLIKDYLINLFNDLTNGGEQLLSKDYTHGSNLENNFVIIENGIKCLNSWIEFGISFEEIHMFVEFLFISINHESLFESSAECLTSFFSTEENLKFTNSLLKFMPRIISLNNLLIKYIHNKDTDGCVVLTKLILAFGENQLSVIFDGLILSNDSSKQTILEFIQLIMSLTSMPGNFPIDEESSDLTFVFWYTLQDTLLGLDHKSNQLQSVFRPYFFNLLEIFIVKLQLANNYDTWSDEDKERHRCYRIDIGDTMVYMISLIGDVMLEFIIKRLVNVIESPESSQNLLNKSNAFNDWKIQEALIYMLQSVVSELNESCSEESSYMVDNYLTSFINILPKINYINKHILSTTLLAVGSLGSWLERNNHLLQNAISICLLGLNTESVTQSASFALKDIINDCDLSYYADQIIMTCEQCLKLGTIAHNYEVRLMSIIGICLSDLLVVDYQRSILWLHAIIDPYLSKLNDLSQVKITDKQITSTTCHVLNLLSQLMSSLLQRQKIAHEEQISNNNSTSFSFGNSNDIASTSMEEKTIVNSILTKLMPIYKQFIKRNLSTDLIIIDKIFESISVTLAPAISNSNCNFGSENIEPYINDLIDMFYLLNEDSWRRYAFEVCRQILIIWWKNESYKSTLKNLFIYSNQNAMKLITKDMKWFHDHTDVVEQYCTCLAKLLKSKYYDLFELLDQEAFTYLIRFAQLGLQLPEQYTLRAVTTFIEELVKFSKINSFLISFMEQNSIHLLEAALIGISGGLPRHLVDILANLFYIYFKEYPQLSNYILTNLLNSSNLQPSNVFCNSTTNLNNNQTLTKEQKLSFIKSLQNESNNKRKFKEAINEFSLICRGIFNTQYAKETAQKR